MVEPGADNGWGGIAVDQRGTERRVGMGPADQHRQRQAVAPPLDHRREQAAQLIARPDQPRAGVAAEYRLCGERERRLVEDVRRHGAGGERAPFARNVSELGQWAPLDTELRFDRPVHGRVRRYARRLQSEILSRRWAMTNSAALSINSATAVAMAAPAGPSMGISARQSATLVANAVAQAKAAI